MTTQRKLLLSTWLFGLLTALVLAGVEISAAPPRIKGSNAGPPADDQRNKYMAHMLNLTGNLAQERFLSNSNRQSVLVFGVHYGKKVRKFTDQKYTVVSLPAESEEERGIVGGYVDQYNYFNLGLVDSLGEQGKYSEARLLCQLIKHFCCPGYVYDEADKRLPYLERLANGDDVYLNRAALSNLRVRCGSRHDYSFINAGPAEVVTNLLQVMP